MTNHAPIPRSVRQGFGAAIAASVLLGSSLLAAPSASAAVGDFTSTAVPIAANPLLSTIALGPDGNVWTTNNGSDSISRVSPAGGLATTFQVPTAGGQPSDIVAGPDGAMWYSYDAVPKIGRVDMNGAFSEFAIPSGNTASSLTVGPDGALWYTATAAKKIGRMTTSGQVTNEFSTGALSPFGIDAGPSGSSNLYVGISNGPKIGIITTGGAFTTVDIGAGATGSYFPTEVDGAMWFITLTGAGSSASKLIADTTVQQTVLPGTQASGVVAGVNGAFYILDYANAKVLQMSPAGALQATYAAPAAPTFGVIGADGNLWLRSATQVLRMLTGVVPALSAAPAVTPASGVTVGTSMSTSNGTWKYAATAYAYAWQRCTSTDVTTCAAITGATAAQYTASSDDNGKYVRSSVTATNANGASQAAYSALVQVGSSTPPAPPAPPTPAPATGPEASIGSGATAELDVPTTLKRGKRGTLEVVFTVTDVQGTVTFKIVKGSKSKTITGVAVTAGDAKTSWKVPSNWPKGSTTVTATFTPATGSPYQGANVKAAISIK